MASDRYPLTASNDIDLMRHVRHQDQNALMALYQRYGNLVYSLALRVLQDASLAEEITQDVFLKIWRQADRWDANRGRLSSWLLTIARHAAIDRLRQEQRRPVRDAASLDSVEDVLGDPGSVDDPLWHDGQLLRELLRRLPEEQRQAVELAYFQGFTHSELARHLGLPLGTVKTRLRLGLQKLKGLWAEAHGGETVRSQREQRPLA